MKFFGKEVKRAEQKFDENGNPIVEEKKPMKTWKKVAIATGATAVVSTGAYVIYKKVFKKAPNPEMVKDAADVVRTAVETALDGTEAVVEAVEAVM